MFADFYDKKKHYVDYEAVEIIEVKIFMLHFMQTS